ncbi:hemerythrin domain-containing protein [Peptoniphilus asaccharolyticus]
MKAIDYLVEEHDEILVFTNRLEEECLKIMEDKIIDEEFFRASIKFIRQYADGVHHKKEEDILFKYMEENLGVAAGKLVRSGMLVEHQFGRSYCLNIEENLNKYLEDKKEIYILQILANSMGYVNLLRAHIEKENTVVYPFGEKNLSNELKEKIELEFDETISKEKDLDKEKLKLKKIIFKGNL